MPVTRKPRVRLLAIFSKSVNIPPPPPYSFKRASESNLPTLSNSLLDQDLGLSVTGESPMSDDGTPLPPPSPRLDPALHTNDPLDPSIPIGSHEQAWRQLISRPVPQDELPSLIEMISSDRKTIEMVDCLQGSDAQAFINVIDGVRYHTLPPRDWFFSNLLHSVC